MMKLNVKITKEFLNEISKEVGFHVDMQRFRKCSKQLATLGPASNNLEMIEKLFLSGADAFRLNFSHGQPEEKAAIVDMIRTVEKKYGHPIAILADLQVKLPCLYVCRLITFPLRAQNFALELLKMIRSC
jgi:pyruvate kinase